jgi:hypothetical protein
MARNDDMSTDVLLIRSVEQFLFLEFVFGPAGAGSPDDTEMFERLQRGMLAKVEPWVDVSRGIGRERVDEDASIVGRFRTLC